MSVILDLGTGAPGTLTTSPKAGTSFYISPHLGTTEYLSVVLAFGGDMLPPDIRVALQAVSDDGETYAVVATTRHGHVDSTSVDTLPSHGFAAAAGARAEFLLVPPLKVTGPWRALAWVASAAPTGHRVTVYSSTAAVVGLHVSDASQGG